jgi:hypothetical protein
VSECDREASTMRRSAKGCCAMELGSLRIMELLLAPIFLMFSGLKLFLKTTVVCFCCSEVFIYLNTYCTGLLGIKFAKFCK